MIQKFLIKGGNPLNGEVTISGYKNSAGALLAAALLAEEPCVIGNLPLCTDVLDQIDIIKQMGAKIEWLEPRKIRIDAKDIDAQKIPYSLFEKMRVSILLIGPLLARFRNFKVPHPGGDKIGIRPVKIHLETLKKFGVKFWEENGFYCFEAPKKIEGTNIALREFSVIGTEIVAMVAAAAHGKTTIEIAAAEPQVQNVCEMLKNMGAKIKGIGQHTLEIEGKGKLSGTEINVCADPLETGTFMIAFALTNGRGVIKNTEPQHLTFFLERMRDIGINFDVDGTDIRIAPAESFKATKIQVLPYPGFPTDLQPQTAVLLTQAQGKSLIHEPLYENRSQHLQELRKMGADIEITDPHRALIFGKTELTGTKVDASDIRAGAALILAGLVASGETIVDNIHHIERGYEKFDEKLISLGAKIERI
ncbi:MAG: UDP-N-acetylglucosamine 1-carboxyvinyltransferase [Candidatus Pacebacteria bacterium]|jgi:UDP-N-acetylglucosamine 1-carboxyvinyltransferase|nr:UDP-N-acetylglucosamine 1-carboxyvinyltransferase [Candidatus Paceibacterota bacterium]